jgi:histidinol-phosphate aminotransferase
MNNIKELVRPNILELIPYSCARDDFNGSVGIFLDANENPYGELNRYPDPYQKELKEMLAELKGVGTNNIFVGNGSDEVIDLAFRIFCRPGIDKALTFAPSYGMYDVSAKINSVELLKISLDEEFKIDLRRVKSYLTDSTIKLIFICSPNNPTGNLMSRGDIEYIVKNFNGIVIIDEAYIDFAGSESLIILINQYNNLIVSQTFSKAWGLASARVGTAYANREIITLYNRVKPPYNVSKINQQAAIYALNNYKTYKHQLAAILDEKDRLRTELEKSESIKKIYPSDANFLLVEVDDATCLYNKLAVQKIITRNRNSQVPNCLRITIGTPDENDKLIYAIKNMK